MNDPDSKEPPAPLRVIIAGQMPPPLGGQTINIKRVYELIAQNPLFKAEHWNFQFTRKTNSFGRFNISKVIELFRVLGRLFRLRWMGKIDCILYSVGGPHTIPVIRDILLLPFARLASDKVVLHFNAAGLKGYLTQCSPILRWASKAVYSRMHMAIVLTNFGKEDAEEAGMKTIRIMPNAMEDHAGENPSPPLEKPDSDNIRFLSVGHLCKEKGTPELIKAFGDVAQEYPEIELHLVGVPARGLELEEIKELCQATGVNAQIKILGEKQGAELDACYRESDVFVFSSVAPYESFGLVLIEAMMWSLPIVVSDWRANIEVAGKENMGGIVYDPSGNHQDQLSEALRQMLCNRDAWSEWGKQNRNRFQGNFQISQLEKNLERFLSEVV